MMAPAHERGAALLAVLAMVVLLSGFATAGLARLKAAGTQISDAQARAEAQLLASAGAAAALALVTQAKARARTRPELLNAPIALPFAGGTVEARLSEGGNCFNLNSLARPPATSSTGQVPAAARPDHFARLLAAVGVPQLEARAVADATATALARTGQLWADPSEWAAVPGVTERHRALAGPLLCTLPSRDSSPVNINSLTAEQAPLLAGLGLGADQARRAVATRPAGGWPSSNDFLSGANADAETTTALADRLGTSSRWMQLDILATTPRARLSRRLLIDSLQTPAVVVSSRWRAVEVES
jgi:general secretion pathway protein K